MHNKNYLLITIVLLLFSSLNVFSNDDPKKIKASLTGATVYFRGAELAHTASSEVIKGANDVWITDLSPSIDVNTLKIKTTQGVVVASYEYSQDFVTEKQVSVVEKNLKDSVKYYNDKIRECNITKKTNNDLLELLRANKSIAGSETGLNVAELVKMVDYYSSKTIAINKDLSNLDERIRKLNEGLSRVTNQLDQESAKNTKSVGILKLNLTSPNATSTDFTITYYTQSAGWIPYYDINVPGMGQDIQIVAKAKVGQVTGLDWNKVKLALSTATPSTKKAAPLFEAWFLNFSRSFFEDDDNEWHHNTNLAQNSISYKNSDMNDELNRIRGELMVDMNQLVDLQPEVDKLRSQLANLQSHEEDNTSGYRVRSAEGSGPQQEAKKREQNLMSQFVNKNDTELNMVYNIDLPYTITGNGKTQNIDLQSNTVSADFMHYSVPKLDSEVYMLAEIPDWQKLNLLSGKANITFDGTYVGETKINASSILAKLPLTLGTDKRVTVKREKLQDFSSKKFMGSNVKQEFAYKLTVKNNQNRAIKLTVKDQYPLSKQKEIEIELSKDITPTTHVNEEVGVLVWTFDLEPGATKELKVAYSVKYPKDKTVSGLN